MKYVGLVLLVIGLGLMGLSHYTNQRVNDETKAAHQATEKLDDNPLVELGGPVTEETTEAIGSNVDNQVENQAKPYEKMANYAHTIGLFSIVLGAVISLFFIFRKFS